MNQQDRDGLNMTLIAITWALLMLLPFVTTFDDLLTSWALAMGANNPLQGLVPMEARMVVGLLGAVGVHAAASGSHLVIWDSAGSMHTPFISWNCIGWQSLILFGLSSMSGLRGRQPLAARSQAGLAGIAGTLRWHPPRVAAVAGIAATIGQTPAILFHDYGGTILVIAWRFAFWTFVQSFLFVTPHGNAVELLA